MELYPLNTNTERPIVTNLIKVSFHSLRAFPGFIIKSQANK